MDHAPECPVAGGSCCPWMGDCSCQCMCDLIKEVEQRVKELQLSSFDVFKWFMEHWRTVGFNEAIDAVRGAVTALAQDMANWSSTETRLATDAVPELTFDQWTWAQRGVYRALAAIDALRGES